MSNLTQLANTQQRRAEQAERTAARHQERVDLWQDHVDNRRPGSSERRRAERELRRARQRRDRAQRRARRHRQREADYRRRALNQPPAPPRPPTRRWVPQGPVGKGVAYTLIAGGVVTGIAIGGTSGFNPFDDDSKVVAEVPVAAGNGGANGAGAAQGGDDGDAADESADESGEEPSESSATVPATTPQDESEPTDDPDETEEPPTTVPPTTVPPTTVPSESSGSATGTNSGNTSTGNDVADEAYAALVDECYSVLELYPELLEVEPGLVDWCHTDPEHALYAMGDILAMLEAEWEQYAAAVDDCFSLLQLYPEVLEVEPALGDWCHTDPEFAFGVIDEILAGFEAAEWEYYAALVDECYFMLEMYPEVLVVDPSLVDWCHTDPEATIYAIDELVFELGPELGGE